MRRFLSINFILFSVALYSIACTSQANAADHLNEIIRNMPVNSWYEVPNSALNNDPAEAQESEFPGIWGIRGGGGQRSANGKFPFSGGILDTKRDRLLIWGAGHNAYYGNELYAFNLQDFTWDRITDPSPPTNVNQCVSVLADGNPNSRHTYYNLDYIPEVDSMFVSPGGATSCGSGGLDRSTWLFDFEANEADRTQGWINRGGVARGTDRNATVGRPIPSYSPTSSAYDPNSGLVYSVGSSGLFDYNVETNFWRKLNGTRINNNGGPSDRGMVIDPKRNKIVVVGGGEVAVYDLDNDDGRIYQKQLWATTGNEFQSTSAEGGRGRYRPGVNYDPVLDRIVVWNGGAAQALNMDTREWEPLAVAPQIPFSSGTYGRFRYSPTQNAYVVVNSGRDNVLIFKASNIPEPTGVALLLAAIPFVANRRWRRQN